MRAHNLDETELVAEGDRSPGVLLGSGYIAGGAIAGIIIAIMQGGLDKVDEFVARFTSFHWSLGKIDENIANWAEHHNRFFAGPNADWLALLPFAALVVYLYFVGKREGEKKRAESG